MLEEEYINARIEERVEQEMEAILQLLEEHLPREEFVKVAGIMAGEDRDGA